MKIWEVEWEHSGYKGFNLLNKNDLEIIKNGFDKGKKIEKWEPIVIKSLDDNGVTCDNPHFWPYVNLLMVSQRAKDLINAEYGEYVQFLPVVDIKDGTPYYMINILNLLDGIDNEKSEFKRLLDIYVVGVTKYELNDTVRNIPIFKLYVQGVMMSSHIFVSDRFKKIIEVNGLTGFKFKEIYDFGT